MGLATFQSAVKTAAAKVAPQYGLTPAELEYALLTDAHLEGGHGDTAGVGDGGYSVGRFQYNTAGGHGSSLINQGYTKSQIADDTFQANDWAPILAQTLANAKKSGLSGGDAIAKAIFDAERPAEMYPAARIQAALGASAGLTGLPAQSYNGVTPTATSTGGTVPAPPATSTGAGGSQADKAIAAWQKIVNQQPNPSDYVDGTDDVGYQNAMKAWVSIASQFGDIAKALQTAEGKRDTGFDQQLSAFNAQVTATHYQNADALASAGADVNRSLNGMQVGTERAKTALDAAKLLAQWGTPAGKSSYSANDLGEAYANTFRQAGLDPSKGMLNYTGTQHIDPTGLANQYDTQLGVGGPLPTIPNFLDVPQGAGMPTPPAAPGDNGISFNDAIAQISGSGGIPLPQGYGSTAGLGDAETPQNAKPPRATSNGIFDPMATLKQLFPGITLPDAPPPTGVVSNRTIDVTKPASAYGGNNATRFLWGDNPATAQQPPNLLGGAAVATRGVAPQFNWFG